MAKHKCDCGKMAVWVYMPGYGGPNPYLCDDCVIHPSNTLGCSCNWHNLKDETPEGVEGNDWKILEFEGDEYMEKITREEGYWIYFDERGRPYPCVEYEYIIYNPAQCTVSHLIEIGN